MGQAKAQVEFQGSSGSPLDKFVNTFHFFTPSTPPDASDAAIITALLVSFYDDVIAPNTFALAQFFSSSVGQNGHRIRIYNEVGAPPNLPVLENTFDLTVAPSTPGLPEEVALVLSFHATPVAGSNVGAGPHLPARKRGRIYFGPTTPDRSEYDAGGMRPDLEIREHLAVAATALMDDAQTALTPWQVWSPTNVTGDDVIGGHIDNAWDTQRRRGTEPTARTLW